MEYVIIFLTFCVIKGTVWLSLLVHVLVREEGNQGCRVLRQSGAVGVDEGFDQPQIQQDVAGDNKSGRKVLAVGGSFGWKRLIWCANPS